MNRDLFFILTTIWLIATCITEGWFYNKYFNTGNHVTMLSTFTLLFNKKHLIFDIFRFVILVAIWAVIGVFSNLNLVIDGEPVYRTLLYMLVVCVLSERVAAAFALIPLINIKTSL